MTTQVLFQLSGELLASLASQACSRKIDLNDLVVEILTAATKIAGPAQAATAKAKALELAIARAGARKPREKFMLEELFSAAEWDQVPSRRVFGRLFRKRIESVVPPLVRHHSKSKTNLAIYERV